MVIEHVYPIEVLRDAYDYKKLDQWMVFAFGFVWFHDTMGFYVRGNYGESCKL